MDKSKGRIEAYGRGRKEKRRSMRIKRTEKKTRKVERVAKEG